MNRLPSEILIPIFTIINEPRQYLQCAFVCRQWHDIIIDRFLYKKLKFKNVDNVYKSMDFFCRKRKYAELVEEINLEKCELDLYTIMSMPTKIPNLKSLTWSETTRSKKERSSKDVFIEVLPPKQVYRRQLGKWKNIEKVSADIERLPFISMLLESATFAHLTTLHVSFHCLSVDNVFDILSIIRVQPFVRSVIENLKNAPALKELRLSNPVLGLEDMEEIHASTPNLETLQLHCVGIARITMNNLAITADGVWSEDGIPIGDVPATKVKSVNVSFFHNNAAVDLHNLGGSLKDVLHGWLLYIGFKYNNLIDMELKGLNSFTPIPEFEQPLVKIIDKLKGGKEYNAFYHGITDQISDSLEKNNTITLKRLTLQAHQDVDELESQVSHLRNKRHSNTIRYLYINGSAVHIHNSIPWDLTLVGLALFSNLNSLSISCKIHYQAVTRLLAFLPHLGVLYLHPITFDFGEPTPILPIVKTKILTLNLTFDGAKGYTLNQLNQAMEFLIQSCPRLTKFSLKGNLPFSKGILNLCFYRHPHLSHMNIDVSGIYYYTFPWLDGKQGLEWANFDKQAASKDPDGKGTHISLSWTSQASLSLVTAPYLLK